MMCENLIGQAWWSLSSAATKVWAFLSAPSLFTMNKSGRFCKPFKCLELMAKIFYLLPFFFFFFPFGGCGVGCGGYCSLSLILHSVFHYLCHRKIQASDISKLAMKQSNRRPSSTTYFQTEPKLMTTCNHRLAQHSSRLAQW